MDDPEEPRLARDMRWVIRQAGHEFANTGAVISGSRVVLERLLRDIYAACDAQGVKLSGKLRDAPLEALRRIEAAERRIDPGTQALRERFEALVRRDSDAAIEHRPSGRVLVVDTEAQGCALVANNIARRGYFVDQVNDTDTARRFIEACRYDMILLGIGARSAPIDPEVLLAALATLTGGHSPALIGLACDPTPELRATALKLGLLDVLDPICGATDLQRALDRYSRPGFVR